MRAQQNVCYADLSVLRFCTIFFFRHSPSKCDDILIGSMDHSFRRGTGDRTITTNRGSLCISCFYKKEMRKLIVDVTVSAGNTKGRAFIKRSACVS